MITFAAQFKIRLARMPLCYVHAVGHYGESCFTSCCRHLMI